MNDKTKTAHVINHRLGRIALYPTVRPQSTLRVLKLPDGSLETIGRPPSGRWTKTHPTPHVDFLRAIQQYLDKENLLAYFYLDSNNIDIVNRRFIRLKQKA